MFRRSIQSFMPRRLYHFKTLSTPNPNALKFISEECPILPMEDKTMEFSTAFQAMHSPLALMLFKIPGVNSVMLGHDFLTVNKQEYMPWASLKPEIVEHLDEFLTSKKQPVITKELVDKANEEDELADTELMSMIKELIETRIRPAIQDDGGDIELKGFDEETGTVFVKLQGACKSCSASEDTLKSGIESMLMHYIEEVKEVVQILDPEEEIAMKEFERLEHKLKNNSSQQSSHEDQAPPSL
ncbi:NifU-like protein, mitochondrial [Candida viswanathii]|uniref:NifU-like protein, mitochondrial n=1 Tax=Candida viswanathii TaxID=5486 RepID=A0A367XNX5_9ASCO|nr:NifU-like protein, mitochondrial [Candida viswanathii]